MPTKHFFIAFAFAAMGMVSHAQEAISIDYADTANQRVLKLEAFQYSPAAPNSQVIVFLHGSTGGKKESIAESIKFMRIGKIAAEKGYTMVSFMRKGRGKSEGTFVEESGKCDRASLTQEVNDAYPQVDQVVDWARKKFNVAKVILMGHSRGGFMSTYFASRNQDKVHAAINLAGVWSAFCESKNDGFSHDTLKSAASQFKNLYWAYFQNDSYFAADRFNDPDYVWFSATAKAAGIRFKVYPQLDMKDGHLTGTWRPEVWTEDAFGWLASLK